MDMFEQKNITPMLLGETQPFDSDEYIFELKLDGARCLAYLGEGQTVLRNRRNKDVTQTYPELSRLHLQADKKCILDGELVVMQGGVPNFEALQKRAHLTNRMRIESACASYPVNFSAFDILYCDGKDITHLPLMQRKTILKNVVSENERLSKARFIEKKGKAFFELTRQKGLEGIVAKVKTSIYHTGVRSNDWLKIKCYCEREVVLLGYTLSGGILKDFIYGFYDKKGKNYVIKGSIFSGGGAKMHNAAMQMPLIDSSQNTTSANNPLCQKGENTFLTNCQQGKDRHKVNLSSLCQPLFDLPAGSQQYDKHNVFWLKFPIVVAIRYMYQTERGGMRQPVFKGFVWDKNPTNCKEM